MSKTMLVVLIILGFAFGASAYIIIATINNQRNIVFSDINNTKYIKYTYGDEEKKIKTNLASKLYKADKYTFEENTQKKSNIEIDLASRPNFIFYDKDKKELYHIYIKDQRSTLIIAVLTNKKETKEYLVKDSDLVNYIRAILMEM